MKFTVLTTLALALFLSQAQARLLVVRDNCDRNLNNETTIDPSCDVPSTMPGDGVIHAAYWRDHGTPNINPGNPERPDRRGFHGFWGVNGTNGVHGTNGVNGSYGVNGAYGAGNYANTGAYGATGTGSNGTSGMVTGTNRNLTIGESIGNYFAHTVGNINGIGNTGDYNNGSLNSGDWNTGSLNSGNHNLGNLNSGNYNNGSWNSGDYNTGSYNGGDHNLGDANTGDWNTGSANSGSYNRGSLNGGNYNFGDLNTGSYNEGNLNSGNHNIGDLNSGSYNEGNLNSGDLNVGNLNSGNYNIGDLNSGNHNTGSLNSGNRNIGNLNSGNRNIGNLNSGNRNIGDLNSGNRNLGNLNSGNRNIGDLNSGNRNIGNLNSGNNNIGNLNSGNHNLGNLNSGNRNIGDFNSGNRNIGYANSGNNNIGIANSGDRNLGIGNSGDRNIGNLNSGDRNVGNLNSGNNNIGNVNSGDHNLGNFNSGNRNLGDFNSGDRNVGFGNSGNRNLGAFNSGDRNIGLANSGNANLGSFNSGNSNTGNWNSGSRNLGDHNLGDSNVGNSNDGNRNIGNSNVGSDNTGNSNVGNRNIGDTNVGDDNYGDSNRGNGNNGDGNRGNYHVGDYNEDEKKLYAHVVPVVFGNIDGMNRVENLTLQPTGTSLVDGSLPLALDDYRGGFFVEKSRKYDIGLGIGSVAGFDRAGDVFTGLVPFSASVGFAVTKGSTVTFSTYVESEDEIETVKRKIPFSGTELESWKKGDSVIYESTGGLQISASAGYWGVTIGGAAMIEGSFKTQVQKLGGSIASLDIMVANTKGLSLVGGGYGVAGSVSYLSQKGKRFKFVIDLSDKEARAAYRAAMVGWLAPLQEMAIRPAYAATVIKIETEKTLLKGHTLALGMTSPVIPLVSLRVAKSEFYQHSYLVNHVGCFQTETEYGIYSKEKKARIFALHAGVNMAFYGGLATLMECGKVVDTDMSGFFTWQYENDYSKSSRLDRNIKELKRLTGLGSLVDVAVPGREDLGYVNADFRVKFPKAYTMYLINTAKAGKLDSIKEKALHLMGDYLKSGEDLYGICDTDKSRLCVAGRMAKINHVFEKIEKILTKMGKTTDSKEFAQEFAELGEKIWDNQFTFKAFFDEGKKCGISLDFKVAGRRISQLKKSLSYPVTAACSVR